MKHFIEELRENPRSAIHKLWTYIKRPRSFSLFVVVGIFNTCVGVTLFPFLYWLFGNPDNFDFLLQVSYVICTISSFVLHRCVTFRSNGPLWSEALKYIVLSVLLYVLNIALLSIFAPMLPWNKVITQTIIAIIIPLSNYIFMNLMVFAPLSSLGFLKKWFRPNSEL